VKEGHTVEVDPDAFAVAHAAGELVIDVREPMEYRDGHVPGARLMPLARLANLAGDLPSGRPIYVICASGNRSKAATGMLRGRGLEAFSVTGGTSAWVAGGRAIVTGREPYEWRPPTW
jgi:rhodanese-related sulfurtransferase